MDSPYAYNFPVKDSKMFFGRQEELGDVLKGINQGKGSSYICFYKLLADIKSLV